MSCTTTLPKAEIVLRYELGESVQTLADSYRRSFATMRENLHRWGAKMRRRGPPRTYELDEGFFRTIDSEEKAYWLGFIFADGSVVRSPAGNWWLSVELHVSDAGHLAKLAKALRTNLPVKLSHNGASAYLRPCSAKLCCDLRRLGCIPNKSYGHPMPKIRKNLLRHFFRGVTDGDGSWIRPPPSTKSWAFNLAGTHNMVRACQDFLMDRLGLSRTKLFRTGAAYELRYTGNRQVRRIGRLLYSRTHVSLDRKKERYFELVA